jgi:outer membrane protein OmpA-like peptidoglycan-associated protein
MRVRWAAEHAALLVGLALAVAASGLGAEARAQQDFRVDRFAPPPSPEDGLGIPWPGTLGHLRPSVGLVFDYAYAPYQVVRRLGGMVTESGAPVEHRLIAHLLGAVGITELLEVHLRLPFAFALAGQSVAGIPAAEGFSLGDGALGGSVRLLGEGDRQGFWMGLSAEILLPFGVENGYASDREVGARGMLTMAFGQPTMTTMIGLGAAYRPERGAHNARSGSELEFALGFLFHAASSLDLSVELLGASLLRLVDQLPDAPPEPAFFHARGTPLEVRAGAIMRTDIGISLHPGLGLGLTSAVGVPTVRAMLGLRWAAPPDAPSDADGDGHIDRADECPEEPEDVDGHLDQDGCPDPDDDADGLPDAADQCPRQSEDRDGFFDEDGCPDPDDDGDGLDGPRDACPRVPGPDVTRGCPQFIRVWRDRIDLNRPLEFEDNGERLLPTSSAVLEELRSALAVDTRMRLRVEVRASAVGAAAGGGHPRGRRGGAGATVQRGRDLGPGRARAIARWLAEHGIDEARIETEGLPPEQGEPEVRITIVDRTPLPDE